MVVVVVLWLVLVTVWWLCFGSLVLVVVGGVGVKEGLRLEGRSIVFRYVFGRTPSLTTTRKIIMVGDKC